MKIESFEGIVLSETNYSESSKILNVLSEEHGLMGVMSKGCRNMKSKLRGVSRKLMYGTFNVYTRGNGFATLISIDVISSFSKILTDLERISYASFILELALQVVRQNEENSIFSILKSTLLKLDEGLSPIALTNIFELKLLDFLGVSPNLDCCSHCGSDKAIITVSSESGGYICKNCYNNEPLVSDKTIKIIRMYYYVDIENITKLEIREEVTSEINKFLDDYYDRYTGLYIKSKDFIKKIHRLSQC